MSDNISTDTAIIVLIAEIKVENLNLKEENSSLKNHIQYLESVLNSNAEEPDVPQEAPDSSSIQEDVNV